MITHLYLTFYLVYSDSNAKDFSVLLAHEKRLLLYHERLYFHVETCRLPLNFNILYSILSPLVAS